MKSAATGDRFRFVGLLVLLVAALRVVSALLVTEQRGALRGDMLLASTLLLAVHGAFYHFGAQFRASNRGGAVAYVGIQLTLAAAVALYAQSLVLAILLMGVLCVQAFTLLKHSANAALVVTLAIATFMVSARLGTDTARAAAISLVVASVGAVAIAVTGRLQVGRRRQRPGRTD